MWYNIMNIPQVKRRVSNWMFTNNFQDSLDTIVNQVKILEKSIWGIRDNKSLHDMFLLILDILKSSDPEKYATGFPIRYLIFRLKRI